MEVALLAGGKSKRMRLDKALLRWQGKPLVRVLADRFREAGFQVLVAGGTEERTRMLENIVKPIFADLPAHLGLGPLAGIETCFLHSRSRLLGVVACDLPLADPKLLSFLSEKIGNADAAVPISDGEPQPLHSVFSRSCLPELMAQLESPDKSVKGFLKRIRVVWVDEDEWKRVADPLCLKVHLNEPEDLNRWKDVAPLSIPEPAMTKPLVLAFVGFSGAGKTTVIEQLVEKLSSGGFKVGVVKHHHGQIDEPGKDTWRHRRAGAVVSVLVGSDGLAVFLQEMNLTTKEVAEAVQKLSKVSLDLILLEGFKKSPFPQIVVLPPVSNEAEATAEWMSLKAKLSDLNSVIGIVSDANINDTDIAHIPRFARSDIDGLFAFVMGKVMAG